MDSTFILKHREVKLDQGQAIFEWQSRFEHRQFGSRTCALKQYAILVTCKMMEPAKNKEELESMDGVGRDQ